MARSTSKSLTSARSEFKEQDPNTFKVNEMDFKMGQMDFNGYMSRLLQSGKITRQRERELQRERYAWRDKRNKERREAKPAKEAEAKRIAGLSEKLVSEMQPYEVALAQKIFEGEKHEQASNLAYANKNPELLRSLQNELDSEKLRNEVRPLSIAKSYYPIKLDDKTQVYVYENFKSKWVEKDDEASKKLAERLKAEGKNVQFISGRVSKDQFLIIKDPSGGQYAVPIYVYKERRNAPTDLDIKNESAKTAKEVIDSYAKKLVSKTEDLVGKGVEFTGKPKIILQGSDPWKESKVELTMGGKKITWKTKMIWNVSKLRKDFNQFPTRLVSQEDA